jgi:hypothetical protein
VLDDDSAVSAMQMDADAAAAHRAWANPLGRRDLRPTRCNWHGVRPQVCDAPRFDVHDARYSVLHGTHAAMWRGEPDQRRQLQGETNSERCLVRFDGIAAVWFNPGS